MQSCDNVMMDVNQSDLLTRQEAAKYLKVSLRTIDNLRSDGALKSVRVRMGRVFLTKTELDEYIDRQQSVSIDQLSA